MPTAICRIHRPFLCALLLVAAALPGCVSQSSRTEPKPEPVPWPEKNPPAKVARLAGDIEAFQNAVGHLPDSLAQLHEAQLEGKRTYATQEFTYHPAGIAILRNGWRLVAASSELENNQLWCIVSPPVRLTNAPRFHVALINLIELREAAVTAENARIKKGMERPEEKTNVDRIRDMVK